MKEILEDNIEDLMADPASEMIEDKFIIEDLTFRYSGQEPALKNINLKISANEITAFIGPSGCGKSTLLRSMNRLSDMVPSSTITGKILLDGKVNVLNRQTDIVSLRRKVGMVFQKPNPFPKSIWQNIAYGLKIGGISAKSELDDRVRDALEKTGLWEELQNRLNDSAMMLSGGQAQRLCIARSIAVQPEVLLMDEPTSALDPVSTQVIEELILELKEQYTVVIVTHNLQQAARLSDYTGFLYMGELLEFSKTAKFFTAPSHKTSAKYITGRFG